MTEIQNLLDRAPDACTLPTVDRPLRVQEFADLLSSAVTGTERPSPTRAVVTLPLAALDTARDLAARETECCSFFTFTVEPVNGQASMSIEVPKQYADVLSVLVGLADLKP